MARKKCKHFPPRISDSDGIDRISNLPDSLIHHILSFLQTVEVARMSILAKRWRYMWSTIPYVDFDFTLVSWEYSRLWYQINFEDMSSHLVNHFLAFREECDILRFRISWLDTYDEWMDEWIENVVDCNVRDLDISLYPDDALVLPTCLKTAKSLKTLKLNLLYGVLKVPPEMGFIGLTFLHLVSITFLDDELTRQLFIRCPHLENLVFERCVFTNLEVLDITSKSLKKLIIENIKMGNDEGDDGLCLCMLVILAPNLVSFKYIGPLALDYCLEKINSIEDVFIQLVPGGLEDVAIHQDLGFVICKLVKGIQRVKVLKLSVTLLEFILRLLGKPEWFPAQFYNLKVLELYSIHNKIHFEVIVHLITCSPNLESLYIDFTEIPQPSEEWKLHERAIGSSYMHQSLKKVVINGYKGDIAELEFIRFLLKYDVALEEMSITCSTDIGPRKALKVFRLPRVSSNVTITFLDANKV